MAVNPYETDPTRVLPNDPYLLRSAYYGRYSPHPDDFVPRYNCWYLSEPELIPYWKEVVGKICRPENYLGKFGSRDSFAAGTVIIRVDKEDFVGPAAERYSCLNANELCAARKAQEVLKDVNVTVPVIYFCGSIDGKNVTVESRIPGVSLEVAWRYLTEQQRGDFKQRCRYVLQRLATAGSSPDGPSYVCRGLNLQIPPHIPEPEQNILFSVKSEDEDLCLVHNDMSRANIVVNDDQIVGILGWRQSGFFGHDRASRVHRQIRTPEQNYVSCADDEPGEENTWADLYDSDLAGVRRNKVDSCLEDIGAMVKIEQASITNLDKVSIGSISGSTILGPISNLDGAFSADEYPTPKKISDLKCESISRASSSERSSPTTPSKRALGRKPSSKKGTATKKSAPKKRKLDAQDTESLDGRRSNTPASSRAGKASVGKKQGSVSVASSPAPENKKKGSNDVQTDDVEDNDDDGELFCICRKPDNHTWMIACDGGCEDWFHGKCVNIDPKDADLIDKYICPNCREQGKGNTTWKPMCRLNECRKPARLSKKNLSKYCSDEHGREFMRRMTGHLNLNPAVGKPSLVSHRVEVVKHPPRDSNSVEGDGESNVDDGAASNDEEDEEDISRDTDDRQNLEELGSRGGVLTVGDLKAAVFGVSSVGEFRKLGDKIVSTPSEENGTTEASGGRKKLGLDIDVTGLTYSIDEETMIQKIRKRRDDLIHRGELLRARNQFMALVRLRAKNILDRLKQMDPKGGWKDICGFDQRLSWCDEEFDEWRLSDVGAKALKDGTLEPSEVISTDLDGDSHMADAKNDETIDTIAHGVCLKKRCERHKQWVKVHQQDMQFEESVAQQDLLKCEREAQAVVERAVLRMWAERDGA